MSENTGRIPRIISAALSAALIGIVGVSAIAPETAQAAGVVVEHRTWGSSTTATPSRDDEES
jgi:hypothetical protein